jgi:hypothetical protein
MGFDRIFINGQMVKFPSSPENELSTFSVIGETKTTEDGHRVNVVPLGSALEMEVSGVELGQYNPSAQPKHQ